MGLQYNLSVVIHRARLQPACGHSRSLCRNRPTSNFALMEGSGRILPNFIATFAFRAEGSTHQPAAISVSNPAVCGFSLCEFTLWAEESTASESVQDSFFVPLSLLGGVVVYMVTIRAGRLFTKLSADRSSIHPSIF